MKAVVRHAHNMACPLQLVSDDGCGDGRYVGLLQDDYVCSSILPSNLEDLVERTLGILLDGAGCTVHECSLTHSMLQSCFLLLAAKR